MDDTWRSYVEEWDRSLHAANRPHTTRYNHELAVAQLADFPGGPEPPAFLAKMDMSADDESDVAEPSDTSSGRRLTPTPTPLSADSSASTPARANCHPR